MVPQRKRKVNRTSLILFIILLLAFFFRFYKLTEWFSFGMDQEYEAFLVKNIVEGNHIPLIGVNAGDTGIYLGPYFIYLSVIPYLLFLGNPLGFAVTASFLGVVVTYLIFVIVKKLFSLPAGLFAAFFYAASFLASYYDRSFWNPMPVPLLSLLIVYFIYRIVRGDGKYLVFLAFVFGLIFHTHLSLLIFTPIVIYVLIVNRQKFSRKIIIWSLCVFLFMLAPLLLFELRHNFTNSRAVIKSFSAENNSQTSGFNNRAYHLMNFLGRFIWIPPAPDLFVEKGMCRDLLWLRKNAYPEIIGLTVLALAVFLYLHHPGKRSAAYALVMAVFSMGLLAVLFYRGNFYEYYLLFLLPFLAIVLGIVVSILNRSENLKPLAVLIVFVFLVLNLITLFTAQNSYTHNNKIAVTQFTKKYVSQDTFNLEALGECPRFGGWRYLFEYNVGTPVHSYMDSYFQWLYQDKTPSGQPEKVVLLSMIDARSAPKTIARWQEDKVRFLTGYNILAEKLLKNIHVFILSPIK